MATEIIEEFRMIQGFIDYQVSNMGRVRIYKKKKVFEKERIPVWTELSYEVEDIKDERGQEFYYLNGYHRPLLRHELLKVRT